MSSKRRNNVLIGAFVMVVIAAICLGVRAGDLEPAGPPGPTMKTLTAIEPRIPIRSGMLPMTITSPGNYYLVEDVWTSGGGINIDADGVTIDLGGFTLHGGTGNGINAMPGRIRITVRNGRVESWAQHGVALGERSTVANVVANENGGNGIQVSAYSQVLDSVADANSMHGIIVSGGGLVRNCTGTTNGGNGIWVDYAMVLDSDATLNDKAGFRVDSGCYLRGCTAQFNDQSMSNARAGIWVTGDNNRIEDNHLLWNNYGIDVDGNDNIIVRNTFWRSRTVNVDVAPGSTGNIIDVKADLTTAGPWSNFAR
jgi:hypothetical protein